MTMLIASCAKTSPAPVVNDTGCLWTRIIYLTNHDIDILDRQTKKDILAHNKAWQANCQKETRASQSRGFFYKPEVEIMNDQKIEKEILDKGKTAPPLS